MKADAYEQMRTLFQESRIELPPDPLVATDVLGVRQRLTRNGLAYDLAISGGRHSDYAPAIAMALMLAKVPPTPLPQSLTPQQQVRLGSARPSKPDQPLRPVQSSGRRHGCGRLQGVE